MCANVASSFICHLSISMWGTFPLLSVLKSSMYCTIPYAGQSHWQPAPQSLFLSVLSFTLSVLQKCHILTKPGWQQQPSVPGYIWAFPANVWALPARFSCSATTAVCVLSWRQTLYTHLCTATLVLWAKREWFYQKKEKAKRRKNKPFFQRSWESETPDYFCFPKCVIGFKNFWIIAVVLFWKNIVELLQ